MTWPGITRPRCPTTSARKRLSEEQYHIPRELNDHELAELRLRIQQLQLAHVNRTPPPPNEFRQPRLLGWPRAGASPAAAPGELQASS